jgi:hypothetical protein
MAISYLHRRFVKLTLIDALSAKTACHHPEGIYNAVSGFEL